jgi:hypothetical protein
MQHTDLPDLSLMLEECCVVYNHAFSDTLVKGYFRVLQPFSMSAIRHATLRLMGDVLRRQVMPSPAEIKALAPQCERALHSTNLDDERWRRRYDVWQRGRFSAEALSVAFGMSDQELGVGEEQGQPQTYIACQQPGCGSLVPWPTSRTDEGRMFCPAHQPLHGPPATEAEKIRLLETATPRARAYLRSILPTLMRRMPVSAEEEAAAAEMARPTRARAFEHTAEGPGVNPGVFLEPHWLSEGLPDEYVERRQMVAAAGWTYDPSEGHWHKGRRMLTDETIDQFPSLAILQDYVRSGAPR